MTHEATPETTSQSQLEQRYQKIDEANRKSFLLVEGSRLQVIGSLHSAGASRELLTPKYAKDYSEDVVAEAHKIGRRILAGNMSPKGAPNVYGPSDLSPEERVEDARANLYTFLHQYDIDPASVRMLRPERDYTTPLTVVDLDKEPMGIDEIGITCPDKAGDFMVTTNPDITLAARPADCPIVYVTAETPAGPTKVLLHLATLGVAHGYIEQAKDALNQLGIDWETARLQITPGAHADTYHFKHFTAYNPHEQFPEHKALYVNLAASRDETGTPIDGAFDYDVDLSAYVYEHILETWPVDAYQVFADTTNTPAPNSGTSSHSRTRKGYEVDGDNTRDVYVGVERRVSQ